MKSFAEIDIEKNGNYLKLLSAVSKLSGLFSESSVPFINYRVAENIFAEVLTQEIFHVLIQLLTQIIILLVLV